MDNRLVIYGQQLRRANIDIDIILRNINILNQYLYSELSVTDFLNSRKEGYGVDFSNLTIVKCVIVDFLRREIDG